MPTAIQRGSQMACRKAVTVIRYSTLVTSTSFIAAC
jgi:hypothetical protein